MTPEDQILINTFKSKSDTEVLQEMQHLLEGPLDWKYILQRARSNRVVSFLYHSFLEYGLKELIPPPILEMLKQDYLSTMKHNLAYYNELDRVLQKFSEQAIEVLLLKGAALAEGIYPNIALRPLSDIDLLIHKEDLSRVQKIFTERGYVLYLSRYSLEFYQEHHFHLIYIKPDNYMTFRYEIHWDIIPPYSPINLRIEELWSDTYPLRISHLPVKTLSPEKTILHLCLHQTRDAFPTLLSLYDIARVLTSFKDTINYEKIIAEARQYNLKAALFYCLSLTERFFGISMEGFNLNQLAPKRYARAFLDPLFTEKNIIDQIAQTDWIISPLSHLFLFKGWKYRLQFLLKYLFPDPKYLAIQHLRPDSLPLRQRIRLFGKGCKVLIHMGWYLLKHYGR